MNFNFVKYNVTNLLKSLSHILSNIWTCDIYHEPIVKYGGRSHVYDVFAIKISISAPFQVC